MRVLMEYCTWKTNAWQLEVKEENYGGIYYGL